MDTRSRRPRHRAWVRWAACNVSFGLKWDMRFGLDPLSPEPPTCQHPLHFVAPPPLQAQRPCCRGARGLKSALGGSSGVQTTPAKARWHRFHGPLRILVALEHDVIPNRCTSRILGAWNRNRSFPKRSKCNIGCSTSCKRPESNLEQSDQLPSSIFPCNPTHFLRYHLFALCPGGT